MASSHTAKERFVVLDGLRGLAALVVITDHVHSDLLTSLLPGRYLAVDFFFVLSGFVLAHVYGGRLRTGMSPLAFMRARVIRLYPLYLVGALIGAAWAVLYAVKGWGAWSLWHVAGSALFALFMLPCPPGWSLWWNAPYPLNGPSWSLFFELLVNAAFAAVARWITPALCLVFMGLGAVLLPFAAFGFGQLDGGFAWSNFVAGFPRVTFGFFAGVWIYQTRLHERVPALPAWAAYLALLAVFMVPAHGAWRAAFDLAAALVLFPSLVTVCAGSPVRGSLLHVSSFIGAMSYGVYVLHVPLWGWLQLVIARFGQALPGAVSVLVVAAVALGAAAALHVIYDAPLRRRLARPRPQTAAAAAGD